MLKGAPRINRPRYKYQMNHDVGTTGNAAKVIPLTWYEVLPGDTVSNFKASYITRLLTPLNAVMDNMYQRVDAFFVPYEIIFQYTKQFFGEVDPGTWQPLNLSMPYFQETDLQSVATGDLGDYLGLPVGYLPALSTTKVSAMPLRAYLKIWNYWYRDELTMSAALFPTDGGSFADSSASYSSTYLSDPLPASKLPDYFTTCLPFTSKIAPVELMPSVPVDTGSVTFTSLNKGSPYGLKLVQATTGLAASDGPLAQSSYNNNTVGTHNVAGFDGEDVSGSLKPSNLWTTAGNITVETLRRAIVYQHVGEILARGGSRYASEFLKNIFGVENSESLYSEPEYLGGFERPINMSEVLSNADTYVSTSQGREIGDNGAFSKTTGSDFVCDHTFTRHGIMMVLLTIRKPEVYWQGLPRKFTKLSFWDHYLPQAQGLGFQKVYKNELYNLGSSASGVVFGFQDYGAEYRFQPNVYSGYMRPTVSNALTTWTWSQVFGNQPTLNSTFMAADNTGIDRTLAVVAAAGQRATHQFFMNFHFEGTWTREVGVQRFPGLDKI